MANCRVILKDGDVNVGLMYFNDKLSKKYDSNVLLDYINSLLVDGVNAELINEVDSDDPISRRLKISPKNGTSKQSDPF